MEAIGQKTVIPVNDEAIAVTEFGIESEDVGENKVFDATLKQELAESTECVRSKLPNMHVHVLVQ